MCLKHSSRHSLHQSCLPWHCSTVLLLSITMLSFCSCRVLLVETDKSNSCLNSSLTAGAERTKQWLHHLCFTALLSLHFSCSLPSPSLFLSFSLTLTMTSRSVDALIHNVPADVTGVWRAPLILTKDCDLGKDSAYVKSVSLPCKPAQKSNIVSTAVQLRRLKIGGEIDNVVEINIISITDNTFGTFSAPQ